MARSTRPRISRESRLLLLTVALCALVLLVLARWRFPDRQEVTVAESPLERLAARAPYEALAAGIQRIEPLIAPSLVVLRLAPLRSTSARLEDVLDRTAAASAVRYVAALRIGAETALAAIDSSSRVDGVVGSAATAGQAGVIATDSLRRLARLSVPSSTARQPPVLPLTALQTPAYVVAVEGTPAGAAFRPLFLGRGDRFTSARWARPLLPLGGTAVAAGALLFTTAGEFIGTVVMDDGVPAIAGARDVLDAVERLTTTVGAPSTLGIGVQPLTSALSTALGVDRGVVVAEVDPSGPAASLLAPTDVITGVDDWTTNSPEELLVRLAGRAAGESVTVHVVRDRKPLTVTASLRASRADAAPPPVPLSFALERRVGSRVTAAPGGSLLQPGDVVIHAGGAAAPTPNQLRQMLSRPTPTGFVVLVVRREERQQVIAIPASPATDAAR